MAQTRARLSGVTKIFDSGNGRVHALGPLDLDLAAGEFVTIVGPSGCGKTTLLETPPGLPGPRAAPASPPPPPRSAPPRGPRRAAPSPRCATPSPPGPAGARAG